jgi:PAS domain S-box-containing protein
MRDLKGFCNYIIKSRLRDVAAENIRLANEMQIAVVKRLQDSFLPFAEGRLILFVMKFTRDLLTAIERGSVAEMLQRDLENWEADALPGIDKFDIEVKDILQVHAAQKKAICSVLAGYAENTEECTLIVQQLEDVYCGLQHEIFRCYLKIQQTLQTGNRLHPEIVTHAPDAVVLMDMQWKIVYWNPSAEQLFGWKATHAAGKDLFTLIVAQQARITEIKNFLSSAGGGKKLEADTIHKDGKLFTVSMGFSTTSVNEESLFIVFIRDISDTKKVHEDLNEKARQLLHANEELRRRELWLKTIFDNAPDAIIATDLNFKIMEWNKTAEHMYGFPREEAIGRSAEQLIPADRVAPQKNQSPGKPQPLNEYWSGELNQVTSEGKQILVLSSCAFIKNEEGRPVGYLGINHDMTELKRMEENLRESDKIYHLLVNEIADHAIIFLDRQGRIALWNKGAEKISGYKEEEIVGESHAVFYSADDLSEGIPEKALKEAARDGKLHFSGWRVRKDKTRFWAEVVLTALRDENGNLQGFIKITRDYSEQKKAAEEILKRTEELKRSNAELEQFAYVASHDLQEPLRMVTSYVQLLAQRYQGQLDKDAHDFIEYAVDGTSRMKTLIYSLLEYSRINRVKEFEYIDMRDIMQEALDDLSVSIKESNARVTFESMPVIYGDKVLVGQLFQNLIGNALKFCGDRAPEIYINGERSGEEYLFVVRDNGIGIQKEYYEKIFVIFKRLHTKDQYPGTGIGLAICKKIVERHEGRIWVESEPGKGSSFYFTINAGLQNQQ